MMVILSLAQPNRELTRYHHGRSLPQWLLPLPTKKTSVHKLPLLVPCVDCVFRRARANSLSEPPLRDPADNPSSVF